MKKEHQGTAANKPAKQKPMSKTQAMKKAQPKKMKKQKKKTNEKWAWKGKPPKDSDSKENNPFVKTFEGKKYYWCSNHNYGAGMWTNRKISMIFPLVSCCSCVNNPSSS